MGKYFVVDSTGVITNVIVAEEEAAKNLELRPYVDGLWIGDKYVEPATTEEITLELLAEHEERLCMLELTK